MKSPVSVATVILCAMLAELSSSRLHGAPAPNPSNNAGTADAAASDVGAPIDFQRLQAIRKKIEAGETPTPEERAYAQQAFQQMQKRRQEGAGQPGKGMPSNQGKLPGKQRSGPPRPKTRASPPLRICSRVATWKSLPSRLSRNTIGCRNFIAPARMPNANRAR